MYVNSTIQLFVYKLCPCLHYCLNTFLLMVVEVFKLVIKLIALKINDCFSQATVFNTGGYYNVNMQLRADTYMIFMRYC